MQLDTRPAQQAPDLLFDWKIDVERLEREADRALKMKQADPWALVEAECSLDLVDAELAAARRQSGEEAMATISSLSAWRHRLERVIRQLRALEK